MTPPKQAKDDPTSLPPEEAAGNLQDNAPAQEHPSDEAPGGSPLQEEIDRLREELAKMRDQWVRAAAEADNIRKRAQRDQEETSHYAVTNFARDMVGVLDNLKRATESVPPQA